MNYFLTKIKTFFRSVFFSTKTLPILFVLTVLFFSAHTLFATTPNPGHPWSEVGDGVFQVTGPTVMRTYTLPDATTTILTTNAAVTVAQGGTGLTSLTQGDILYASASNTLSALAKPPNNNRLLSNFSASNNPAWVNINLANSVTGTLPAANSGTGSAFVNFTGPTTTTRTFTTPDANATFLTTNAAVTLAQGGTGANLTASNGGILYTNSSTGAILAGTATAGQILRSGSSAAPSWSTATYPATAGTSGNFLVSDGTNWVSTAPATVTTVLAQPFSITGAASTAIAAFGTSLTTRYVGLFPLYSHITINQVAFNTTIGGTSPSYTMKICIYNEAGSSKLLDVTSGTLTATGNYTVTVSPAVTLDPGNYYLAVGNATQSGTTPTNTGTTFVTASIAMTNGASVPSGKTTYEGTVTHSSGVCDSTLGTITATNSATVGMRLDN